MDLNVRHSLFCLYFSITAFFPTQNLQFMLVLQGLLFWVQNNLIKIYFNSILWSDAQLSLTSSCKIENGDSSTYTFLRIKISYSYWTRSPIWLMRFCNTNPTEPVHIPSLHTAAINRVGAHYFLRPSLSLHLTIFFDTIHFVDLYFESVVMRHERDMNMVDKDIVLV